MEAETPSNGRDACNSKEGCNSMDAFNIRDVCNSSDACNSRDAYNNGTPEKVDKLTTTVTSSIADASKISPISVNFRG